VNANGDQVYFFALTYTGKLRGANAQQAWVNGFHKVLASNISLHQAGADIVGRTSATRHFLIGWWNKTARHFGKGDQRGGWEAADANPGGKALSFISGDPNVFGFGSPPDIKDNFFTNGTMFQLQLTPAPAGLYTGPSHSRLWRPIS
jgi:hypothetical protein